MADKCLWKSSVSNKFQANSNWQVVQELNRKNPSGQFYSAKLQLLVLLLNKRDGDWGEVGSYEVASFNFKFKLIT